MSESISEESYSQNDTPLDESEEIEQSDVWQVSLLEGESIASYLYRLRLQNAVSAPSSLSQELGLGIALNRWEKFRTNFYFPTEEELELLSNFCGEPVERLLEAFPPEPERKRFLNNTIRLCAACCVEASYHRLKWQFSSVASCDRHNLSLLARCPGCKQKFEIISSLWTTGECKCGMRVRRMVKHQVSC